MRREPEKARNLLLSHPFPPPAITFVGIEWAAMNPDLLARSLQEFLAEARGGVVIEDGQVIFDLDSARYSISTDRGRCLLHLWSEERNAVREVLDAELKQGTLVLTARKFAKA